MHFYYIKLNILYLYSQLLVSKKSLTPKFTLKPSYLLIRCKAVDKRVCEVRRSLGSTPLPAADLEYSFTIHLSSLGD